MSEDTNKLSVSSVGTPKTVVNRYTTGWRFVTPTDDYTSISFFLHARLSELINETTLRNLARTYKWYKITHAVFEYIPNFKPRPFFGFAGGPVAAATTNMAYGPRVHGNIMPIPPQLTTWQAYQYGNLEATETDLNNWLLFTESCEQGNLDVKQELQKISKGKAKTISPYKAKKWTVKPNIYADSKVNLKTANYAGYGRVKSAPWIRLVEPISGVATPLPNSDIANYTTCQVEHDFGGMIVENPYTLKATTPFRSFMYNSGSTFPSVPGVADHLGQVRVHIFVKFRELKPARGLNAASTAFVPCDLRDVAETITEVAGNPDFDDAA